jgi:hypothetical protein
MGMNSGGILVLDTACPLLKRMLVTATLSCKLLLGNFRVWPILARKSRFETGSWSYEANSELFNEKELGIWSIFDFSP